MRQLQATLTRIFIVLESESHGLSESETDFSAKIGNSNGFSAKKQVISKKKRSSPKLRRFFRPELESQTVFQAESRQLLHNFGTQIPLGRGLFSFFQQKSASEAPKTCGFAYFTGQWGGSSPPPGYATESFRVQKKIGIIILGIGY